MKDILTITQTDNGYVVEWQEEDEESRILDHTRVFEEGETTPDGEDNVECMKYMLEFVAEHFGIFYSKHHKNNLVIEVVRSKKEGDE